MNDKNLEKAFLAKFSGAVLKVPKKQNPLPNSVGSMIDPEDIPFCKITRFKFREKPLLNDIVIFLREYYDSIGWKHNIESSHSGIVIIFGSVWPANVSRCLCPAGIFERDKNSADTNIFCYSLNPIIG